MYITIYRFSYELKRFFLAEYKIKGADFDELQCILKKTALHTLHFGYFYAADHFSSKYMSWFDTNFFGGYEKRLY